MLTKPCPFASHGLSLLQLAFLLQLLSQAKKKGLRERKVKAQDHRKKKKNICIPLSQRSNSLSTNSGDEIIKPSLA
jgi:Flp pilus assembly protein TadB